MKLLLTALCAGLLFAGCASQKNSVKQSEQQNTAEKEAGQTLTQPASLPGRAFNHSFLNESHVGQSVTVSGLLQKTGTGFKLTEDYKMRSAVSFILTVDAKDEALNKALLSRLESECSVTGTLTEASSKWTKKLTVTSVN